MKIIQPSAEWWPQTDEISHLARVGRICYKSKGAPVPPGLSPDEEREFRRKRDKKLASTFEKSGHVSMLRHVSVYFYVPDDRKLPNKVWALLTASPFIAYSPLGHKVWISTNANLLLDDKDLFTLMKPYQVDEDKFIELAIRHKFDDAIGLVRMTMVVTTQISTSRELNRTSPNAIAEQSTRYCNLEKKGGVQIAEPHWLQNASRWQRMLFTGACRVAEWAYLRLLHSGMKPQDARGVLPLDTYTVVAYTYDLAEWKRIIDLRFHGTTGAPHPNAKIVCSQIRDIIINRFKQHNINIEI